MHFVVSSAHLHCTNYTAWFARVFFLIVFDLCEEGSIRLKLLPVCCWPCHVMSIMGSPSCLGPELVASAFVFGMVFTLIPSFAFHGYVVVPSFCFPCCSKLGWLCRSYIKHYLCSVLDAHPILLRGQSALLPMMDPVCFSSALMALRLQRPLCITSLCESIKSTGLSSLPCFRGLGGSLPVLALIRNSVGLVPHLVAFCPWCLRSTYKQYIYIY